MKQLILFFTVISLSVLSVPNTACARNDLKVWNEVVAAMQKKQKLTEAIVELNLLY